MNTPILASCQRFIISKLKLDRPLDRPHFFWKFAKTPTVDARGARQEDSKESDQYEVQLVRMEKGAKEEVPVLKGYASRTRLNGMVLPKPPQTHGSAK